MMAHNVIPLVPVLFFPQNFFFKEHRHQAVKHGHEGVPEEQFRHSNAFNTFIAIFKESGVLRSIVN